MGFAKPYCFMLLLIEYSFVVGVLVVGVLVAQALVAQALVAQVFIL